MSERIIVIGGGAAGLMAAGRAAELGARVLLLEKTKQLGTKLRLTGSGRCNLTNDSPLRDFLTHLGPNASFLRNALARFFAPDTIDFFNARGVPTVIEEANRVFPASNSAHDVAGALRRYCLEHGVQFRYLSPVNELVVQEGQIAGARVGELVLTAGQVILATGGMSYPTTGSTGDGYRLAEQVGHTIVPLRPGLVPLVTSDPFTPQLQGLSLQNVRVLLYKENQLLASAMGDVVFTHFGVSGPAILTLSTAAADALQQGPLRLALDLRPDVDEAQLDAQLRQDLTGKASYHSLLKRLLPRTAVDVFRERSEIPAEQRLNQFTAEQRGRLRHLLKAFDLTVVGTRPISEAMVTLGGVSVAEIDPRTMASRKVRGLYFAGEIIDVAGDTGGYNLQIAFTTGYLAGEHAARTFLGEE